MPKSFIPVDHLTNSELKLLEQTKQRIPEAKSHSEISYYKLVLDNLLMSAFEKRRRCKKAKMGS